MKKGARQSPRPPEPVEDATPVRDSYFSDRSNFDIASRSRFRESGFPDEAGSGAGAGGRAGGEEAAVGDDRLG